MRHLLTAMRGLVKAAGRGSCRRRRATARAAKPPSRGGESTDVFALQRQSQEECKSSVSASRGVRGTTELPVWPNIMASHDYATNRRRIKRVKVQARACHDEQH